MSNFLSINDASKSTDELAQAFAKDGYEIVQSFVFQGQRGFKAQSRTALNYETREKKTVFYVEGSHYQMGYLLGQMAAAGCRHRAGLCRIGDGYERQRRWHRRGHGAVRKYQPAASGIQFDALIRYAGHRGDSAAAALQTMIDAPRGVSWIYLIADGKNNRAAIVEAGAATPQLTALDFPLALFSPC